MGACEEGGGEGRLLRLAVELSAATRGMAASEVEQRKYQDRRPLVRCDSRGIRWRKVAVEHREYVDREPNAAVELRE